MATIPRNGKALRDHISTKTRVLISNFESILAESMSASHDGRKDYTATMDRNMQMGVNTRALVRGTEDLMVVIRHLQELWFYGNLDTLNPQEQAKDEPEVDLVALANEVIEAGVNSKDSK